MPATPLQAKIHEIRNSKVMLDFDLANLYEIETRILNQAVKRNIRRFPLDFMFQLTAEEVSALSSQIVILNESAAENIESICLTPLPNKVSRF